jgi:hypothetical protein
MLIGAGKVSVPELRNRQLLDSHSLEQKIKSIYAEKKLPHKLRKDLVIISPRCIAKEQIKSI